MEEKIIKKIYIKDVAGETVLSFEANEIGLSELALKYTLAYEAYTNSSDGQKAYNLIFIIELYKILFDSYDFSLELKNDKHLRYCFYNIKLLSDELYSMLFKENNNIKRAVNTIKSRISEYSIETKYEFINVADYEKLDINNLKMMDKETLDIILEIKNNIEDYDDDLEYDISDEEINLHKFDPSDYEEEELTCIEFPIHKDFLHFLNDELISEARPTPLAKLIIYSENYLKYFKREELSDEYKKDYDKVKETISLKKDVLKSVRPDYSVMFRSYKNGVTYQKIPAKTIYNDKKIFLSKIFEYFVNINNLDFFKEMKALFVEFNIKSIDDCRFLIKNFSDLIEEAGLKAELKCLKHLVTDDNILEFCELLYSQFRVSTNSFIFNIKFNANTDEDRGNSKEK